MKSSIGLGSGGGMAIPFRYLLVLNLFGLPVIHDVGTLTGWQERTKK
jgi:hypothetical protein